MPFLPTILPLIPPLWAFHKDGRKNRCGNDAYYNSKAGEDGNRASSPDLVEKAP